MPVDGAARSAATRYAQSLLGTDRAADPVRAPDPVADWAASGAMALTGDPDGPPVVHTGAAVAVRGALLALAALRPDADLPGPALLGERAALAGLHRRGAVSCGGATRLLPALDGHVAVSLARDHDVELVPALVEDDVDEPWDAVARWVARTPAIAARDRGRLLGLPVTVLAETTADRPFSVRTWAQRSSPAPRRPLVVDLSALWAGPLCASLLGMLGCEVVKVEDPARPDGARRGSATFFDLLNAGASSVALDLQSAAGRTELARLLRSADVVIEGSRPRALAQLGLPAEQVVAAARRLTWVSITGHGRGQPDRVGYGDDAAVAGGLVGRGASGPVFVADAVADPLTGLHAAIAAWQGVRAGDARLVDVPLSAVASVAARLGCAYEPHPSLVDGAWTVDTAEGRVPVAPPHARAPRGGAPPLAPP